MSLAQFPTKHEDQFVQLLREALITEQKSASKEQNSAPMEGESETLTAVRDWMTTSGCG
jgi:hypothetical protein